MRTTTRRPDVFAGATALRVPSNPRTTPRLTAAGLVGFLLLPAVVLATLAAPGLVAGFALGLAARVAGRFARRWTPPLGSARTA